MTNIRISLLVGAALVAVVAMGASAATLAGLGEAVGWHEPLHWSLPVAVDVLALVAGVAWLAGSVSDSGRRLGCWLTVVSVVVSVVLNAVGHLVDTGHVTPGPGMVIAVSAVPPLAAALAVHLAAVVITPGPTEAGDERETADASTPVPPASTPPAEAAPAPATEAAPLPVICGGREVYTPTVPPATEADGDDVRLSTEAAREAIERGWREGLSVRETARLSTRSPAFVGRVYRDLEEAADRQQSAGQLALVQ